jgi:broad specificity phosphatase PhoE
MTSRPVHLLLVRHAQAQPYSAVDPDPGLTPAGAVQAALLADWLRACPPDALWSSTLRRARQTATIVSERTGVPVRPDPRLREVGMCRRDGKPVDRFQDARRSPRDRPLDSTFPDGERWVDFRGRVGLAIDSVLRVARDGARRVVIVCHGGTVDALFDNITGARTCGPMEIALANTGMCHVEHRPAAVASPWILHGHNLLPHLRPHLRPHPAGDAACRWAEAAS